MCDLFLNRELVDVPYIKDCMILSGSVPTERKKGQQPISTDGEFIGF